jgi:hypothetical protein
VILNSTLAIFQRAALPFCIIAESKPAIKPPEELGEMIGSYFE